MKFARIIAGLVTDVVEDDPAERFHPTIAAEFEPVGDDVQVGWRREGDVFVPGPDSEAAPVRVPVQMATIDFLRRFEVSELAAFNALRKAVAALTPTDYAAAASGDQAKAALVGFEVFLTFYDALSGVIEIDHPQTIAGLELLVPLGVLQAERLDAILGREVAP